MSDAETTPRPGERLVPLLKRMGHRLFALHADALDPLGIDVRDLGAMLVIDGSEPSSQQEIAARMGVDRTTMVALLDGLEVKGILARRPDPGDRRRNVVELTTAGASLLREATAASDRAEAELLSGLSAEEGAQLRGLMARVVDRDVSER